MTGRDYEMRKLRTKFGETSDREGLRIEWWQARIVKCVSYERNSEKRVVTITPINLPQAAKGDLKEGEEHASVELGGHLLQQRSLRLPCLT